MCIRDSLGAGKRVGYDSRLHTLSWQRRTSEVLEECSVALVALEENPIDRAWHDRPVPEIHPAVLMEQRFTGRASLDKRREIGALITEKGADAALIFAADSIAWLLNIRGSDVPHVPVVLGYARLTATGTRQFFPDPEKIPPGFAGHVGAGVEVLAESRGAQTLAFLGGRKIIADPDTANAWCQLLLESSGARLIATPDPVLLPKACKNAAEIDGMRRAHIRDAVAECRFLAWLDAEVAAGRLHDEAMLCERLFEFRADDALFRDRGCSDVAQHRADGRDLAERVRVGTVDDVQQQVRLDGFLQRRAERLDQVVWQVSDEPDCVGEGELASVRGP